MVLRGLVQTGGKVADVYYYSPGPVQKQLRSHGDVFRYLQHRVAQELDNWGLTPDNFVFKPVTVYKPPSEVVRNAFEPNPFR